MPLQLGHRVDLEVLEAGAAVRHFDFVDDVAEEFGLDGAEGLEVGALAEEASDAVPLLDLGLCVSSQAGIADDLCAMSALFWVYWHLEAGRAPQYF